MIERDVTEVLHLLLQQPKEEVVPGLGETYSVAPKRPHLVPNGGTESMTILVLLGVGDYD